MAISVSYFVTMTALSVRCLITLPTKRCQRVSTFSLRAIVRARPMQLHIQMSVPTLNAGRDPRNVYHYTTGRKLLSVIHAGHIKPSTAQVPIHERPVAWFSTSPAWEPTATKVPIPGMAGQIVTARAQSGLVRITVPGSCAPYVFAQLPLIAGTKPSVCIGLLLAGLKLGSEPDTWRFTPTPVPTALFRAVEFYDFANDRWLAVDLAELVCRS